MLKKILFALYVFFLVTSAHSNEVGWSVYPLKENQKIITAQFGGVFSGEGGYGITASYLQKLSPKWDVEAGAGFTGGDEGFTLYGAGNYELFPDYDKQPKVTLKGWYQYSDVSSSSVNRFYISPLVSKSTVLWGAETFPYVGIPTGVNLNYDNKQYSLFSALTLGISGNIPWEKMKNVMMLVEAKLNITGAYSGISFGFSHSL